MRKHTLALFVILFLTGFVYTLFHATQGSGTGGGNLWLLTCLILGFGLIATSLAAIAVPIHARFVQPRQPTNRASTSMKPATAPVLRPAPRTIPRSH